jgi:hypothetical protein
MVASQFTKYAFILILVISLAQANGEQKTSLDSHKGTSKNWFTRGKIGLIKQE